MRNVGLAVAIAFLGCAQPRGDVAPARAPVERARPSAKRERASVARPSGTLTLKEAREYMLKLVNRDRATEGLEPVVWDDTAAKAGQKHADDMVLHGFTGHLGTDGSVPEQRYTLSGGMGKVQENAACIADGAAREIDKNPRFSPEEIEKIEAAFFGEKPPNDGHRRNILKPWHNKIGIGMTKASDLPVPCTVQELVDAYGKYKDLPAKAKVGQMVAVEGEVFAPATFGGIGLARIAMPKPLTVDEVNAARRYHDPDPYATFFPKGFVTPIPVNVDGRKFSIKVPLSDGGKPGLYEVSVWVHFPPNNKDLIPVSLRTIAVE